MEMIQIKLSFGLFLTGYICMDVETYVQVYRVDPATGN